MRVLVFGDSITQGFFAETAGWVQRLFNFYGGEILKDQSGDWIEVFNLGISGDRTDWLAERFDNETQARIEHWQNEDLIIMLAIGINDTGIDDGKERSNPAKYEKDLTNLISKAKKFSDKIIMVGLTACEEDIVNGRTYKSKQLSNDRIKEFEDVLAKVCDNERVKHLPIFEKFITKLGDGQGLLADGLHPNDEGHKLIFELVRPDLDKMLNT